MKTKTLRLAEYQTRRVRLSRSAALSLQRTPYVTVTPDPEPRWWQVTAGHYVGTLVSEDLRIHIQPKIRLENLFLLLGVGLREQDWKKAAALYDLKQDLLPAVISFFTRSVDLTLRRGIYRSYRIERERLPTIRGRLDIPRQLTRAGVVYPIDCRFDEYTADVAENRYLMTAALKALGVSGVLSTDRRRLHRILGILEEVSTVPVRPELLDRMSFNRLNAHYEPSLRLARLLLENLTLRDDPGETQALSFMVDMNFLFERYVTDRLQRTLRGRLQVKSQRSTAFDQDRTFFLRPDLVFYQDGTPVFVADIKYKRAEDQRDLSTSNHNQLLAYTTVLDLPEGALIYCREPDAFGSEQESITVRHSGKTIHAWGLDISGPPSEVEAGINELGDWIADRGIRATPLLSRVVSVAS